MLDDFLHDTEELKKKNEPFAIAMVVRREAPSSGKVGDKAVINKYGEIIGWVGGGCVKGIIVKEAENAMKTGTARLVKIGKTLSPSKQEGVMEYNMTCQSEGTVEVFIEPILPQLHLMVIGKSAIAKALVKMGKVAGYRITGVAQDANLQTFDKVDELITQVSLANVKTTAATFIVVATQGEGDEKALTEAVQKDFAYLGFVASKKKFISIKEFLQSSGLDKKKIESIASPAGIDINAKKPEEVAISIMAQIIQIQNSKAAPLTFEKFESTKADGGKAPVYYINPVCGVPVDINNPKHVVEYKNEKIYFCCDGCKVKFDAEPEKYISMAKAGNYEGH
jgi:xanthine dehydrogenase accessory factor